MWATWGASQVYALGWQRVASNTSVVMEPDDDESVYKYTIRANDLPADDPLKIITDHSEGMWTKLRLLWETESTYTVRLQDIIRNHYVALDACTDAFQKLGGSNAGTTICVRGPIAAGVYNTRNPKREWVVWTRRPELELQVASGVTDQTQPPRLMAPPAGARHIPESGLTVTRIAVPRDADRIMALELWNIVFAHCTFDDMLAAYRCCYTWRLELGRIINKYKAQTGLSTEALEGFEGRPFTGLVARPSGVRALLEQLPAAALACAHVWARFDATTTALKRELASRVAQLKVLKDDIKAAAVAEGREQTTADEREALANLTAWELHKDMEVMKHERDAPTSLLKEYPGDHGDSYVWFTDERDYAPVGGVGDTLHRATIRLQNALKHTIERDGRELEDLVGIEQFGRQEMPRLLRMWRPGREDLSRDGGNERTALAVMFAMLDQFGWDRSTMVGAWGEFKAHRTMLENTLGGGIVDPHGPNPEIRVPLEETRRQFEKCAKLLEDEANDGGTVELKVTFDFYDPSEAAKPANWYDQYCWWGRADLGDRFESTAKIRCSRDPSDPSAARTVSKVQLNNALSNGHNQNYWPKIIRERDQRNTAAMLRALNDFVVVNDRGEIASLDGENPAPLRVYDDTREIRIHPRPDKMWKTLVLTKDYDDYDYDGHQVETWTNVRIDPATAQGVLVDDVATLLLKEGRIKTGEKTLVPEWARFLNVTVQPTTDPDGPDPVHHMNVSMDVMVMPLLRKLAVTDDSITITHDCDLEDELRLLCDDGHGQPFADWRELRPLARVAFNKMHAEAVRLCERMETGNVVLKIVEGGWNDGFTSKPIADFAKTDVCYMARNFNEQVAFNFEEFAVAKLHRVAIENATTIDLNYGNFSNKLIAIDDPVEMCKRVRTVIIRSRRAMKSKRLEAKVRYFVGELIPTLDGIRPEEGPPPRRRLAALLKLPTVTTVRVYTRWSIPEIAESFNEVESALKKKNPKVKFVREETR